jgi:uncharacterized membrane protein YdbT with pleckstrin-like domain
MKNKYSKILDSEDENNRSEEVYFVLHQSPSFFNKLFFHLILLFVINLVVFYIFGSTRISYNTIIITAIVGLYLFIYYYYLWSQHIYILTNQRFVIQRQKGWFYKTIDEISLDSIQYVSHSIKGINQHIFNTGDIFLRSYASEKEGLKIENISNPYEVQKKITEIHKKISFTKDKYSDKNKTTGNQSKIIIR